MANVVLRRFVDPIGAQLARAQLEGSGIHGTVLEPTSFNPLLAGAAGGYVLEVDSLDVERAEEILRAQPEDDADDADPDAVRCPRCELEYTNFGKPTMHTSAGVGIVAFAWLTSRLVEGERWYCEKCGHRWENRDEGPQSVTRLPAGVAAPVFRLRRARPGTGLLLGLFLGPALALLFGQLIGPLAVPLILIGPGVGWWLGGKLTTDYCSNPDCRDVLMRGQEKCFACRAPVVNVVLDTAEEHYVQAAEFRREFAKIAAEEERKEKRRRAKRKKAAAQARQDADVG